MVGLVDEQQNFVFFHKDSLSILGQVFKVVCHTDKNLRIILAADPHIERRKLWEIGRMMMLLLTVVTRVVTQVVHNSLLLVVKHGMLFKATTLKRYFINVTTDDRELASFLEKKKKSINTLIFSGKYLQDFYKKIRLRIRNPGPFDMKSLNGLKEDILKSISAAIIDVYCLVIF